MRPQNTREYELTEKLLKTFHLNIPERKELFHGKVKFSVIQLVIKVNIDANGWFPADWRPDQPFFGGLLETLPENKIKLYHKEEASFENYKIVNIDIYNDIEEAIIKFLKITFGNKIDDIPIDYEA